MPKQLTTTKLSHKSKKELKKIADRTGEKMYRVIERLITEEQSKHKA